MQKQLIRAFLEAIAVGDAFGKVTEYCTREQVQEAYNGIRDLLTPEASIAHRDLFYGQVTDDTEQNLYLIQKYAACGRVAAYDTALALLDWVHQTDAATKYIGPNTLKALRGIEAGEDIATSGSGGTTCGGMMRTPSAFLFSTEETLYQNIVQCLMPTHFTAVALEAAVCYGYALQAAAAGQSMEQIIDQACLGAQEGRKSGNHKRVAGVAPSCARRIRYLQAVLPTLQTEDELKDLLYYVLGATLASADVCACVFGIFLYAGKDVYRAVRLAAELGGDTDTIGCLAAGLCTLYAGGHDLPAGMVTLVAHANHIDFEALAQLVADAAGKGQS